MPVAETIDNETYLNQREAARFMGIARDTFYKKVHPRVKRYKSQLHGRAVLYKQTELEQLKEAFSRPIEDEE